MTTSSYADRRTFTAMKEKPSSLSKKVLKTQLRNEWENGVLEEKLKCLDKQRYQQNHARIKTAQNLYAMISDIKKVKTRFSISPERRQFLLKNGFSTKQKDFSISDYLELMDDVIDKPEDSSTAIGILMKRPHTPPIRLQDFIQEQQDTIKQKKIEMDTNETQQPQKQQINSPPTTPRLAFKKLRVIEPPINGREMWKVHIAQTAENKQQDHVNKGQTNILFDDRVVEIYRKKITGKLMSSQSATKRTSNIQRPSTAPLIVKRNHQLTSSSAGTRTQNPIPALNSETLKDIEFDTETSSKRNTVIKRSHSVGNTKLKVPLAAVNERRSNSINISKTHNQRLTRELQITIQGRCAKVFVPKF